MRALAIRPQRDYWERSVCCIRSSARLARVITPSGPVKGSRQSQASDGTVHAPQIGQAIEEVNSNNQELLRKYRRELQLRKKCHNELVRLKGECLLLCVRAALAAAAADSETQKNQETCLKTHAHLVYGPPWI